MHLNLNLKENLNRSRWIALVLSLAAGAAAIVSSPSCRADEGMWLLNHPPLAALKKYYGFQPTAEWLQHVQKSCVRFSSGGSGSIVSADGLVMTNHHVASDTLHKFSTADRNLIETGFYAKTPQEELKAPDLELLALWSIEDVTERVKAAATESMSPAEAFAARREAMSAIEVEAKKRTGLDCQVITLYGGGLYQLYCYKRYTDVRLVFAPEMAVAFFGGDNDNFEYPRYDLDVAFFRIYEGGKPLHPEHYLKWSEAGSKEDDLALVFGHPARTQRFYTVDHLRFLRDVQLPLTLQTLWRREVQLQTFSARSDENARIALDDLFGVQNSRKAYTGIIDGLLDPSIFSHKHREEATLQTRVKTNPEYEKQWFDAWQHIADAEKDLSTFYTRYALLEGRRALRSDLYDIARHLVRLAAESQKPSGERLREYRESELDSLDLQLFSPAPISDTMEIHRLSSGLAALAENFGADDPTVRQAFGGFSPETRATMLVQRTKLKDVAFRHQLADGGIDAIAKSEDPMIQLARELDPEARALRKRYEDEVESVERANYSRIAAARFAVYGADIYPDATFTLRMSYGPIMGYEEQNQKIPAFTTIAGAFEHMRDHHGQPPYRLPDTWMKAQDKLDLTTPLNFVCTADIIGGNSGSPVVNTQGEVIGLIFDGNRQSLIWDIVYTAEQGRAVSVDSRAIVEALRKVYDAGALADEITAARVEKSP